MGCETARLIDATCAASLYLHFLALSASFYSETQKLLLFRVIVGCANHLNYYKVSPPFTIPDSLPLYPMPLLLPHSCETIIFGDLHWLG